MTPIHAALPGNYTTTVYSPAELPRLLDYSTPVSPSENRPRGGNELADGPPSADPRLGVVADEEVVMELPEGVDVEALFRQMNAGNDGGAV